MASLARSRSSFSSTSSLFCTCLRSNKGKTRATDPASTLPIYARQLHSSGRTRQAETLTAQQQVLQQDEGELQSLQESASGLQPGLDGNVLQADPETTSTQTAPRMEARQEPPMSDAMFEVLERRRKMALMESLESIGSTQTRHNTWQPHHTLSRSQTPSSLTLSHLLASTAHLGHSTSLSSPMAFPYIYGTRHGISIIDVRETLTALRRASALVKSTVENDGIILFLGGGMKETERVLAKNAEKLGRNGYSTNKWMPGTLTNSTKLFSESSSLIQQQAADPSSSTTGGYGARRGPSVNATHLQPSLLVLFSPLSTPYALREANAMNIPTIALCDSNVDPRHFTYPIPCNDDSLRVVELVSGVLAEAGKEGIRRREAQEKYGQRHQQNVDQEQQGQGQGQESRYRITDTMERPRENRYKSLR